MQEIKSDRLPEIKRELKTMAESENLKTMYLNLDAEDCKQLLGYITRLEDRVSNLIAELIVKKMNDNKDTNLKVFMEEE